jgi:multiple sugar transport system ATP-binding protein
VAGFLGSPPMNFVDARLVASGGAPALQLKDGVILPLPPGRAGGSGKPSARNDRSVVLGVRPEHLSRATGAEQRPGLTRHAAVIDLLQPTGSRTYATFQLGGTPAIAELQSHDVSAVGERIEISIDMNRVVLFDPETDRVI